MFKAVACAVACLAAPIALDAQQGSPYVPLDDAVMPFVEHLIRSGVISDPDPLTRPLKRSAILTALAAGDTGSAPAGVRAMIRQISTALESRFQGPRVDIHFYAALAAGTHARRDPLRAAGPKYGAWQAGMELWAAMGPLVLSTHPLLDSRLADDPDYPGVRDRPLTFRFTDAYASVQPRFGEITYGSVDRNWGPTGIDGLIVSAAPYSYDHLFVRLGVPAFRFESELAQLNDTLGASGTLQHRWWVAHRFVFRIQPWITGVIGEATLWKGGGPAEQTWFLNPTRIAHWTNLDENLADSVNTMISGDLSLRLPRGVVLQAQALIDDIALFGTKTAPDRLAGTLVLDVPLRSKTASVRLLWTVVSSLAYRTFEGPITYAMRHQVGLGRNFDDYSQWTLSGTLAPDRRVVLSPEVTLLLQGEGDLRKPMPAWPNPNYPFLLVGSVERTWRVGLSGRALGWRGIDLNANAGVHFVTNSGNVAGASATRFVGAITLRYRFGEQYGLP